MSMFKLPDDGAVPALDADCIATLYNNAETLHEKCK